MLGGLALKADCEDQQKDENDRDCSPELNRVAFGKGVVIFGLVRLTGRLEFGKRVEPAGGVWMEGARKRCTDPTR